MNYLNTKSKKAGLTLIETILYIALSSLIITGILVSTYPLLIGADQTSHKVIVTNESVFVLRKVSWALGLGVTDLSVSPAGDSLTITASSEDIIIEENNEAITINGLPITTSRIPMTDWLVVYTPKVGLTPGFMEVSFKADTILVGPVRYNLHF